MINQQALRDISKKLKVLNYAKEIGNISKTCRYFGICRETFYTRIFSMSDSTSSDH